jgi:hypothetical protein
MRPGSTRWRRSPRRWGQPRFNLPPRRRRKRLEDIPIQSSSPKTDDSLSDHIPTLAQRHCLPRAFAVVVGRYRTFTTEVGSPSPKTDDEQSSPNSGGSESARVLSAAPASTRDEPAHLSDSRPKLISIVGQPVLLAATRCYLIHMLRSAMACTNGCSCWSPDEKKRPQIFLTMEPPRTAVRTAVPAGHARPSGPKLSVLLRRSCAFSFDLVLSISE